MNTTEKMLIELYPNARPGFVKILVAALDIHSKKNHDYNNTDVQEYIPFETLGKFFDIRRKYSRLNTIISREGSFLVDETLEDTALDLGVYALLFAEYIKEYDKQKMPTM